jgi:hypothetical protein
VKQNVKRFLVSWSDGTSDHETFATTCPDLSGEAQKQRTILARVIWPAGFADSAEKIQMKRFLF